MRVTRKPSWKLATTFLSPPLLCAPWDPRMPPSSAPLSWHYACFLFFVSPLHYEYLWLVGFEPLVPGLVAGSHGTQIHPWTVLWSGAPPASSLLQAPKKWCSHLPTEEGSPEIQSQSSPVAVQTTQNQAFPFFLLWQQISSVPEKDTNWQPRKLRNICLPPEGPLCTKMHGQILKMVVECGHAWIPGCGLRLLGNNAAPIGRAKWGGHFLKKITFWHNPTIWQPAWFQASVRLKFFHLYWIWGRLVWEEEWRESLSW